VDVKVTSQPPAFVIIWASVLSPGASWVHPPFLFCLTLPCCLSHQKSCKTCHLLSMLPMTMHVDYCFPSARKLSWLSLSQPKLAALFQILLLLLLPLTEYCITNNDFLLFSCFYCCYCCQLIVLPFYKKKLCSLLLLVPKLAVLLLSNPVATTSLSASWLCCQQKPMLSALYFLLAVAFVTTASWLLLHFYYGNNFAHALCGGCHCCCHQWKITASFKQLRSTLEINQNINSRSTWISMPSYKST